MARMSATRRAAKAKRGTDPTHVISTGDRVRTGHVRAPRKFQVTDRQIKTGGIHGAIESPITEYAQNRHVFTGDHERFAHKAPVVRSACDCVRVCVCVTTPVRNGSANAVRIAQMPTGTKPVWR
jgi:hypothetical protein